MNFFTSLICCGKRNKNADAYNQQHMDDFSSFDEKRVLQFFNEFEGKLVWDLKSIPVQEFISEAKLLASYDGSISTRQLSILYQKFNLQFTSLISIFAQDFFFKNQIMAQAEYDAQKMYLFNLLYCQGDDQEKLSLIYDLVVGPCLAEQQQNNQQQRYSSIKVFKPNDERIIRQLEYLITIPTILMANIIEQSNKLNAKIPEDQIMLEELARVQILLTDSANSQLKEFAGMISREFFFQNQQDRQDQFSNFSSSKKQSDQFMRGIGQGTSNQVQLLSKSQFIQQSLKLKFKLTQPQEIRSRFLKMLEAKVNIMRNSINFTLINNRDSILINQREIMGFESGTNLQKQRQQHHKYQQDQYNFHSQEDEEVADELFKKALSPSRLQDKFQSHGSSLKNLQSSRSTGMHSNRNQNHERSSEEEDFGQNDQYNHKNTFSSAFHQNYGFKASTQNRRSNIQNGSKVQHHGSGITIQNSQRNSLMSKQMTQQEIQSKLEARYTPQLVKFYKDFIVEKTSESQTKINRNREYLKSIPKFTFDLDRKLHPEVRNLIEYLKLRISVQDIKDVDHGSYFGEEIYGLYLMLLKVFNCMMQDINSWSNLNNKGLQSRHTQSQQTQNPLLLSGPPKNMIFLETNEIMQDFQSVDISEQKRKYKGFFEKNSVLAPVLLNTGDRKQAVLVHINPITLTAELYYKPNQNYDNSDISEQVLSLLDQVGSLSKVNFDDDEVEGKIHEVDADTEEDMLIFACYIAECLTFKKDIDIQNKGISYLRNRIVDAVLSLTYI